MKLDSSAWNVRNSNWRLLSTRKSSRWWYWNGDWNAGNRIRVQYLYHSGIRQKRNTDSLFHLRKHLDLTLCEVPVAPWRHSSQNSITDGHLPPAFHLYRPVAHIEDHRGSGHLPLISLPSLWMLAWRQLPEYNPHSWHTDCEVLPNIIQNIGRYWHDHNHARHGWNLLRKLSPLPLLWYFDLPAWWW